MPIQSVHQSVDTKCGPKCPARIFPEVSIPMGIIHSGIKSGGTLLGRKSIRNVVVGRVILESKGLMAPEYNLRPSKVAAGIWDDCCWAGGF